MAKKRNSGAHLGFESQLWPAADMLRNNLDAAEYKHVEEEDEPFDENMKRLTSTVKDRSEEAARLDQAIWAHLNGGGV